MKRNRPAARAALLSLFFLPLALLACGPEEGPAGAADASSGSSNAVAAPFSWTSSGVLISPKSDASHSIVSIKDPTVVNYGGKWHVYATVFNRTTNTYNMAYLSFSDWSQAASATWYYMDSNPGLTGYKCAPQAFYFAPQNKWYLVYQTQPPAYSTASAIGPPSNWSAPKTFYTGTPSGAPSNWIDFWVICDSSNCYLFFSGDDGKLYRSQTTVANFPNGFGSVTTVMSMSTYDLFEASNVYKLSGQNKYLLLVEAIGASGRYYKAFTSTALNGSWTTLAGSESSPFAGKANVSFPGGAWTNDVSHGEMIRAGYDQTMTINDGQLQYLYQGSTGTNSSYNLIPWSLGLLTQNTGSGGSTTLVVRARGTSGSESVTLKVGSTTVATWTLSTTMSSYTFTTTAKGNITLNFTNDASGRDVQCDYIQVNGVTRQAEDQATNTGSWNSAAGTCGGVKSEWMYCGGYIDFGSN